jgi:hypothetical protein
MEAWRLPGLQSQCLCSSPHHKLAQTSFIFYSRGCFWGGYPCGYPPKAADTRRRMRMQMRVCDLAEIASGYPDAKRPALPLPACRPIVIGEARSKSQLTSYKLRLTNGLKTVGVI